MHILVLHLGHLVQLSGALSNNSVNLWDARAFDLYASTQNQSDSCRRGVHPPDTFFIASYLDLNVSWSFVAILKAALMAFQNGSVLEPPSQTNFSINVLVVYATDNVARNYGQLGGVVLGDRLRILHHTPSTSVIGGYFSENTVAMARMTSALGTPHIGFGAESTLLSNKREYAYYFRTASNCKQNMYAVGTLLKHWKYRKANMWYSDEQWGQSCKDELMSLMVNLELDIVFRPITTQPANWKAPISQAKQFKAVAHIFNIKSEYPIREFMQYAQDNNLISKDNLWLGSPDIGHEEETGPLFDGYLIITPVFKGRLWQQFWEWWQGLREQKAVLFEDWIAANIPEAAFESFEAPWWKPPYIQYLFDATWAMVLAINTLHAKHGLNWTTNALKDQLAATDFEGISGRIKFDDYGDRVLDFEIQNFRYLHTDQTRKVKVGEIMVASESNGTEVVRLNGSLRFYGGSTERPVQPDCPDGSAATETGDCIRERTVTYEIESPDEMLTLLSISFAALAVLVIAAVCTRMLASCLSERRALQKRDQARIKAKLCDAIQALSRLKFPMVLVNGDVFCKLGKLVPHEEARETGILTFLDTSKEARRFLESAVVVFFSHQWLAYDEPDPDGHHYDCMQAALRRLARSRQVQLSEIHLWVDYTCIPQKCDTIKALSILTLPMYATLSEVFIIVCPTATHADDHSECNKDTYMRRAWCRLEMLAFVCTKGHTGMNIIDSRKRLESVQTSSLDQALYVYEGELTCCSTLHSGGRSCDREAMVLPLLGLLAYGVTQERPDDEAQHQWSGVHVFVQMRSQRSRIFPDHQKIQFADEDTPRDVELFAGFIDAMDQFISESPEARNSFRPLRALTQELRRSSLRTRIASLETGNLTPSSSSTQNSLGYAI